MATLINPGSVDLVTLLPSGEIGLIIAEEEPWTGEAEQLQALSLKLKNYTGYALDGQLLQQYPEAEGNTIVVQLSHAQALPPSVQSLIEKANEVYGTGGLRFETYQVA